MDGVASSILAEAGELIEPVAVLDDVSGALTHALIERAASVRAWCDDVRDQAALPAAAAVGRFEEAVRGARTVLWRLPRAVSAVADYAERIAAGADAEVRVVAGGRNKDLARAMNDRLAERFDRVWASRGVGKARVLHAEGARAGPLTWPRTRRLDQLDLLVSARGATFNTNRLDAGTALLVRALVNAGLLESGRHGRAVDVGSGSGILAALLARAGWTVLATDVSAAACESTALTVAANSVEVAVMPTVGLAGVAGGLDLVVTNPPFHRGTAKDSTPTRDLFEQAGQRLRPGGELWVVFNSHLPYLGWLRELIGPTRVITRDRSYTVTLSTQVAGRHRDSSRSVIR